MKFVEQDGNIFKDLGGGKYEHVPRRVEQDGNVFEFDTKSMQYSFVPQAIPTEVAPQANAEDTPRALRIGLEKAASLYTRPAIAGLGGAAGAFVGELQQGRGFRSALQQGKEAFSQARSEALLEQEEVAKKSPLASAAGELVGTIATAPLMPVRSLAGALKLAGATGVGQTIGEATSKEDALKTIGTNLAFGAATFGIGKGIEKGAVAIGERVKALIPEKFLAKIASTTTGIPDQDIITYSKNVDEINSLINKHGGDVASAADEVKVAISESIQKARASLGNGIKTQLESYPSDKVIPIKPIIAKIEEVAKTINKKLYPEVYEEIADNINKIKSLSKGGKLSVQDLNDVKMFLQDNSTDAFVKNGQIFPRDTKAARAAKAGYTEARSILNELDPTIAEANNQLHQLHVLEKNLNKNLIAPGKPASALIAAGSGENQRNLNQLKLIGQLTGTQPVEAAQKLGAMKSFADTRLLPQGPQTGITVSRIASGAGLGALVAEAGDADPKTGALIGAAATGPTALKALINTGNFASKNINNAIKFINNPSTRSVIQRQLGTTEGSDDKIDAMKRRLMNFR